MLANQAYDMVTSRRADALNLHRLSRLRYKHLDGFACLARAGPASSERGQLGIQCRVWCWRRDTPNPLRHPFLDDGREGIEAAVPCSPVSKLRKYREVVALYDFGGLEHVFRDELCGIRDADSGGPFQQGDHFTGSDSREVLCGKEFDSGVKVPARMCCWERKTWASGVYSFCKRNNHLVRKINCLQLRCDTAYIDA